METAHQNLLQQLTSLSKRYPTLGSRLASAAQDLQNRGQPFSENLLGELVKYNRDFNRLQQQVLADSPERNFEISSVQDLERLVQDRMQPADQASVRQNALGVVERVLRLIHKERNEFSLLKVVKDKARQLQTQISQETTDLQPDIEALVSGEHPLSALLTLVESPESLDDEHWVILEEKVAAEFGKPLAVAISRGKIAVAAATQATRPQPPSANPNVVILGEPTSTEPQDVIIVPSVEVPKNVSKIDRSNIVFGNVPISGKPIPSQPRSLSSVGIKILVHLQGLGDREFAAQEYAGTRGQGRRLEAFQINIVPAISGLSLQYMAHISGVGDTPMIPEGQLLGERGKERQIEGFAIQLTGPQAANYDVFYTAHIQNRGDVPVSSNGEYCGTRQEALRIEGLKVWIQPKA